MKKILTPAIIFLLLTVLVIGLSFTSSPSINQGDSTAITTDDLSCEWTASGDTTQTNITWLRDGVISLNKSSVTSPQLLGSGNTTRGEVWNCTITIANATATLNGSDTITIDNADPLPLQVLNESLQDIGNSTTLLEDIARTFNVTSTDPDGDTVTYSALSLPGGSNFNTVTGIFTWTPNGSQANTTHNVTFIALDNQTPEKGSTAKDISFFVQEVNDDPVFNPALTNQTAFENQNFTYEITVTDEESDFPINFTMSTTIGNLIINITSNTTANITFVNGSPTFADRGNHTVNITINDSRGGSTLGSFNLEVIPVNQLPTLTTIPNQSGTQGSPFSLVINSTDADVADTLTFSIQAPGCPVQNPWTITKLDQVLQGNVTFANASISHTLNNTHVACNFVNVSVTDSKEITSQTATFNIANINDAPEVHQNSTSGLNTDESNITRQTAFVSAVYVYQVNATDPDQLVSGGEVLTYTDNTTLFTINSSTGVITFTPNSSTIGNHSILINVSDDEGLSATIVMSLEIRNNTAPAIVNPGNLSCAEDIACIIYVDAFDADGDNMTFESNSSIFTLTTHNATAGIFNFTLNQSLVGNHTVFINATDIRGATDNLTIRFTVNNTNDAPVLDFITFPFPIVVTKPMLLQVTADDEDITLLGAAEQLNFSNTFITSKSLFNISTSFNNATNASVGTISFTPTSADNGTHTVNISVSDPNGLVDWQTVTFTVFNDTEPPNITTITPYGTPVSNVTVFASRNTSEFPISRTTINLSENTTVVFNHTTTDDETAAENLTFTWYFNTVNVSTNHSYTRNFTFFSAGDHNLSLTVYDDKLESSSFTWFVNVTNVNRIPILYNDLENVSISSTETFTKYLELRSDVKFLDPDDDTDSSGQLDGSETNSLQFEVTACSVADISISATTVTFTPEVVGSCNVVFTAIDDTSGTRVDSNTVVVNVSAVPEGSSESPSASSSSGGGGGGGGGITRSSSSIVIPRDVEVDKPKPLSLIAPDEVTLYRNRSITVPIFLDNTWNNTLTGVDIAASTNVTGVDISFDETHFDTLVANEKRRVDMTVSGYRLGDNFEVLINATVEDPVFIDNALILFNSIEQAEKGEQVEVKVTFARDLLSSNEECQELGELVGRAETEYNQNNYDEALKIIDTVINGCKYLVSKSQINVESPSRFDFGFLRRFRWFYAGAGLLLFAFIGAIVMIEMRIRKERNEEESTE